MPSVDVRYIGVGEGTYVLDASDFGAFPQTGSDNTLAIVAPSQGRGLKHGGKRNGAGRKGRPLTGARIETMPR